jgi:hypothetical protein
VTPDEEGGPPWAEVLQKEFGTLRHGTSVYDARLLQTLRVTAAADSVLLVFDDHAGRRSGVRVDANLIWDAADPPVGAMKLGDLGAVAWTIVQTMVHDPAHDWELGAPDQDGVRWRKADAVRPRRFTRRR